MMPTQKSIIKEVTAASLGGGLEMYDFVLYVFFAPIIANLFFDDTQKMVRLIAAFGVFAAGYLVRPLGGIIFGHFGDIYGRKKGLIVSMSLMGVATMLMGCLPTYHQIGIWAPILLVTLRLLQGIAVGGDFPGAMTFVAESSANKTRGLNCSWTFIGINMGTMAASLLVTIITNTLSISAMSQYGWRIAFFSSIFILILGFYFRHKIDESKMFAQIKELKQTVKHPILSLLKGKYIHQLILGIGFIWIGAIIISQFYLYMPTYLHLYANMPLKHALTINTVSLFIFSAFIPVFGFIADHIGHKKLAIIATIALALLAYPIYSFILSGYVWTGLFIADVTTAPLIALMPILLPEIFPTKHRFTGIGLSYNISFAVLGGCTPLFLTYLLHKTNAPHIVCINIIIGCVVTLFAVAGLKDKTGKALN